MASSVVYRASRMSQQTATDTPKCRHRRSILEGLLYLSLRLKKSSFMKEYNGFLSVAIWNICLVHRVLGSLGKWLAAAGRDNSAQGPVSIL